MAYNYAVTCHKPTAVHHSLACNLTGRNERNVLISKGNRLELHTLTNEGLVLNFDVSLYGKIAVMLSLRPPSTAQEIIFILTGTYKF